MAQTTSNTVSIRHKPVFDTKKMEKCTFCNRNGHSINSCRIRKSMMRNMNSSIILRINYINNINTIT